MITKEVVAAIIKKDGRYFAAQRGYGKGKDGWEFPGGKMEPGESREDAIVREIREELATDIKVDSFLTTVDYDYDDFHLTMHCFLCSIVKGNLDLLEHEDAKWLAKEELDSVNWLATDKIIVERIKMDA